MSKNSEVIVSVKREDKSVRQGVISVRKINIPLFFILIFLKHFRGNLIGARFV